MAEKIKWWMLFISICIGITGGVCLLDFARLRKEIDSLNQQVKQQNMLIDYLEQEVQKTKVEDK